MSLTTLQLAACDPIIARDGRPFGPGQGFRMRGLSWPLPSVVAGSFRTALVKAEPTLHFGGDMPKRLLDIEVAGVFPTAGQTLYLPAPSDCVWDEKTNIIHRVRPVPLEAGEGADMPMSALSPVRLTKAQAEEDFKPQSVPAWWPLEKYVDWLTTSEIKFHADWFDKGFLGDAVQETRDHVCLDPKTGAAAESLIFATSGLNVAYLPRHGVRADDHALPFGDRFAEITLAARATTADAVFAHLKGLRTWHPLGGERRLVHWQSTDAAHLWKCPAKVQEALGSAQLIRMILATPAIFKDGWRPNWLDATELTGKPVSAGPTLKLVGISNARWKAVSGWSMQPHPETGRPGPKPIRRMVPAGSVYFFQIVEGDGELLATNGWLKPVSDVRQDRNDGFGLAVWGAWQANLD